MTQLIEIDHPALGSTERYEPAGSHGLCVCPLCFGESRLLFQKQGIWIRECSTCRHRYSIPELMEGHVSQTYSDDYFFGGGAGYNDYLSESGLLTAHGRRYAKILSRFARPSTILDVGAAAGFVLKGMAESGWTGVGVEPNSEMARHGRDVLGLDVRCGTLESMPTDSQFDVVSMIQVMAHFIDPQAATQRVADLVAPGGFCRVETWNGRSLSARRFGANWHEYSPPSVLHWFSPQTLTTLFAQHGFDFVGQGRPSKRISIGHARSLLQHGEATSLLAKSGAAVLSMFPEQMTLPYPSEDLFWMVFRKV